jgi:hypothetical protein
MDNTTIVTSRALLSAAGPQVMAPLTVWALATFIRAVVCYERIYHHEHPSVDDAQINGLLGAVVLQRVPLPLRVPEAGNTLPHPWNGAHCLTCNAWTEAST